MKNRSLYRYFPLLMVFAVVLMTSCGTFEFGIEQPGDTNGLPTAADLGLTPPGEDIGTPTIEETVTLEPTPTVTPLPSVLQVAFAADGNVWLWREGEAATPLTTTGEVEDVRISGDGQIIAFTRSGELWAVNSDGTGERLLVSGGDFAQIGAAVNTDLPVNLHHYQWVPGTHKLAFNTRLQGYGLLLNEDLNLVDADTLERTVLLPPGEGGEFVYSPDGAQVALATAGKVRLMDADGSNLRDAFTYTLINTASEAQYYALPTWAPDASFLRVIIPPVDPMLPELSPSSIWQIPTDGSQATMIDNVMSIPLASYVFSPDLNNLAYLGPRGEYQLGEPGQLVVTSLTGSEDTDLLTYPDSYQIYGWSPDSGRIAFLTNPTQPQAMIGQLGVGDAIPVFDGAAGAVIEVEWVDNTRYLFLAQSSQGWDIVLGEMGGAYTTITTVAGALPSYDFVR
jgi:dipeptidyl aminopeptidase/acylaminoacyl peptidase